MSRNLYLVCYDIREPKRLRRTHQTMLGYGDPLQYSVFLCDLSPAELVLMEDALKATANFQEDSVLVVDLGPAEGIARRRIRAFGLTRTLDRGRWVVV